MGEKYRCNKKTFFTNFPNHATVYQLAVCLVFCIIGIYLGMTIPILTVVRMEEANTSFSRAVTIAYYLPSNHQAQPPQPLDPDIVIEEWTATTVYTRSAIRFTTRKCVSFLWPLAGAVTLMLLQ